MDRRVVSLASASVLCALALLYRTPGAEAAATLPDGRSITPIGFTTPVEGFATSEAMSPDGTLLAVLSQDGGAIDIIVTGEHTQLVQRLPVPFASGMTWTKAGLFVTRGYSGFISRFAYNPNASLFYLTSEGPDFHIGGLLNGIADSPSTDRLIIARTASNEVDELDSRKGNILTRLHASGQPFSVAYAGTAIVATLYNSDHIDVWSAGSAISKEIFTGPHPTEMLVDGHRLFVADADGHEVVAIDTRSWRVTRRYELGVMLNPLTGQTPSGMAISNDGKQLFIAESGLNDVAVVDVAAGTVLARIPTAWYPTSVIFAARSTIDDDPRIKPQLFIVSAKGLGTQSDAGSEHGGIYTGLVQHIVLEPQRFASWSTQVASNDRFDALAAQLTAPLPPIKHFVFIVHENKHFDEEFGDEPGADADPTLLLFGRRYTPNGHALAETYTLFDDFMGNGESSDFAHSWTTQGMANDYLERNIHTPDDLATTNDPRIAGNIWPIYRYGEDAIPVSAMDFDWFQNLSALPRQPRTNVSAVFGPRGELIDELQRKGVSFRVYGEQMTMLQDGRIAPGLAAHADRAYPGAHIDFNVSDTTRASLFLADVRKNGLAQYSYLTLPTDHTSGFDPGFYTPASYVSNNDVALGEIIAGLSKMPEWRDTVVFVSPDDPQGTGDHVNSRRMPAFLIGPYVRRGFIDHTPYSLPSVLRTVEVLFGLSPLNIHDALAPPMLDAFAAESDASSYQVIPSNIKMTRNPGKRMTTMFMLDGPNAAAIASDDWLSIKGRASYFRHLAYLRSLGPSQLLAADLDDR